ncbi:MAG: hypothetical protein P0Y58_16375 [Candidatus Pseudomonas phytovorans]|uniref:Uncharacterized protein n=1 Tax=Candidatus Pseudomonas phytovorans TaxID=3121377 RepID=A0AAJ5WF00_9PSED|nr:hypothetical protein [Pseudomonas sp.]WEK28483.1 MAG: hypothetical protein P0Y58_16375 [Pseudomonas sp.]
MFITHKQAELALGELLGDGSTQCWQYVEQTTHCPWFYVKVAFQQDNEAFTSMLMLPSISSLEQVISEQTAGLRLLDVQLVSPGYLNGSDGWMMEKLLELRETVDDIREEAVYVYSLEGGKIYTEGLGSAEADTKSVRIIFSHSPASR